MTIYLVLAVLFLILFAIIDVVVLVVIVDDNNDDVDEDIIVALFILDEAFFVPVNRKETKLIFYILYLNFSFDSENKVF